MFPICQRYALKAIHNRGAVPRLPRWDVSNMSKIRFESNSQQRPRWRKGRHWCFQYVKDTLWKQFTTNYHKFMQIAKMFPICQRYALKAIHNALAARSCRWIDVSNMSKIRFESNSQQVVRVEDGERRCFQYVKDTLWKQFTTKKI